MTDHFIFYHQLLYTTSGWGMLAVIRPWIDQSVERGVHKQLCAMLKEVRDAEAKKAA